MKLTTFLVAKTKENKAKLITSNILTNNYQNKCKISLGTFSDFADVCNYLQRFLHENETVQYL